LAKGRNPIHPKKQLHQMNKIFKNTIAIFILLFSSNVLVGQNDHLQVGILSTFDAFAGSGAITNNGTLTNDAGTNDGIISGSGFTDTTYLGTTYNNDSTTVQARIDLIRVYIHLCKIFVTSTTHAPAFGSGEAITKGVYTIPSAGTLSGNLTLNGGGDPNAIFILKFEGAFTAAVASNVILSGNTRACNVYWIAEGAIVVGANSTIKGTLFSHPGGVTIGTGCDIDGRLLSTEGAITLGSGSVAEASSGTSTIPISYTSNRAPATAVDVLGSIEDFAMFTSSGNVSNAATSGFIGDIGTNLGTVTGYSTSPIVGDIFVGTSALTNATTAQAKLDLDTAYQKLIALPKTDTSHLPAFGTGETITPGVYYIGGAGSLAGTITLNGQNDSDAIFVLRFNGAFSVAAQAKVILDSGARLCNVFWIAEGALDMGTFVYMKGTVLAHGGACTMAANGNLEGRMLSTAGAVTFSTGVLYINPLYFPTVAPPALPIKLLSFTAEAVADNVELNWVTASEINNNYFNVEYSRDGYSFTSIIKRTGAGNSAENTRYTAVHNTSEDGTLYYRLKQTDFDGTSSYSDIVAVDLSADKGVTFNISPNPMHIQATITTSENLKNASLIVYNSHMMVKQINNISGRSFTFQREELRKGLYWISLVQDGQVIETKKIVLTD
jgi:hypothetical protein